MTAGGDELTVRRPAVAQAHRLLQEAASQMAGVQVAWEDHFAEQAADK